MNTLAEIAVSMVGIIPTLALAVTYILYFDIWMDRFEAWLDAKLEAPAKKRKRINDVVATALARMDAAYRMRCGEAIE